MSTVVTSILTKRAAASMAAFEKEFGAYDPSSGLEQMSLLNRLWHDGGNVDDVRSAVVAGLLQVDAVQVWKRLYAKRQPDPQKKEEAILTARGIFTGLLLGLILWSCFTVAIIALITKLGWI